MTPDQIQGKVETIIGVGLLTTPFWAYVLTSDTIVASCIAAICGAIIGLHGVYKLRKKSKG